MRAITLTVALTALLVFLGFQAMGQPPQKIQKNPGMGTRNAVKRIIVQGPRGHALYYYTNTYKITWQCMNITQPLKILFMSDTRSGARVLQTLATNVPPGQRYFNWLFGKRYSPGDQPLPLNGGSDGYFIRIETMDGSIAGEMRWRLPISVLQIKVTSPTGRPGPEFRIGQDMVIQWTKSHEIKGNVDIELWKNTDDRGKGGAKLLTIARNIPAVPGNYNWRVALSSGPTAVTRPINCQIRIRSVLTPECLWSTWEGRFRLMPTARPGGTLRR